MSVMKAIKQMKDESDIMRAQGCWTDEEIDRFVSDFCDTHDFPKASVENVIAMAEAKDEIRNENNQMRIMANEIAS